MFFIPGQFIAAATFPGVIVHELAHQIFCRLLKIPVFEVCYFRMENPAGYVIHEKPKEAYKSLLISIGPFIINTILGSIVAAGGAISLLNFHSFNLLDFFLVWLGVSIAMHAFPSRGDADSIWKALKQKGTNLFLKIIGIPIVGLIYLGSLLSFFWFDLIYGVAVAVFIPDLIINLFV